MVIGGKNNNGAFRRTTNYSDYKLQKVQNTRPKGALLAGKDYFNDLPHQNNKNKNIAK